VVGEQPPKSFSISLPLLSIGGGATTLTLGFIACSYLIMQTTDPRTHQFWEVVLICCSLSVAHQIALFSGLFAAEFKSGGIPVRIFSVLPIGSVATALALKVLGRWHWGQVILAGLLSLLLTVMLYFIFVLVVMGGVSIA
jgi:hypothetical protein